MVEIQNADMSLFWTWSVDIDTWNKHRYSYKETYERDLEKRHRKVNEQRGIMIYTCPFFGRGPWILIPGANTGIHTKRPMKET